MKPWLVIVIVIAALLVVILAVRAIYEYVTLTRTDYKIETEKLPAGKKKRLLVISDLHDRVYGQENEKLLDLKRSCLQHVILVTGDILTA